MYSNIDLVIFDCDGVLIDSEIISARMLQAELKLYNVDIPFEYIIKNYIGRSYPTVLSDAQKTFDVLLDDDFGEKYRERLMAAFVQDLKRIPYIKDVIEQLNIPKCVATSSSPKRVATSLEIVGLDSQFGKNVYTASQVENGKPAPDLFLFAAKKMGVPPHRCLVIEDSLTGVEAGLAAGMSVIRFTGGSHIANTPNAIVSGGALEILGSFDNFFELCPELKLKETDEQ